VTSVELKLPKPLAHQSRVLNDPSRRKAWRAGRRVGKSIAGMVAGTRGHGPRLPNGQRELKGMLDGGNIAWLTKTYKQSKVVWRRLLKRFRPLEGVVVSIDREDRRISMLRNEGALTVWSGHTRDAIDNLRGDGYDGIILDEAAYMDAEYAIAEVSEPALLDTGGWLFVFSSPNAGWDGNDTRTTPSYFNRLCQEVMDGKRQDWRHWHNRTEDNPRLNVEAVARLRAEYGEDSPTVQQEMDALLLAGGLLSFVVHREYVEVAPFPRPRHWPYFAAFDWGYNHPFSFGLFTTDDDGTVYLVDRVSGRRLVPKDIALKVGVMLSKHGLGFADLQYTVAGLDCWAQRKSHGEADTVRTIADQCAESGWAMIRADVARISGANNIRVYLRDRVFKVIKTPGALAVLSCLESRINDPTDPEDVLKVDADQDGRGGDDDYDMLRYGLASRPVTGEKPRFRTPDNMHPGLKRDGLRKTREWSEADEVADWLKANNVGNGGRYGRRVGS
jgi:hypothetical protein